MRGVYKQLYKCKSHLQRIDEVKYSKSRIKRTSRDQRYLLLYAKSVVGHTKLISYKKVIWTKNFARYMQLSAISKPVQTMRGLLHLHHGR